MSSRRHFLKSLSVAGGGALAASSIGCRLWELVDAGTLPNPSGLGISTMVATACGMCGAGCAMRIRLVDGLPVGVTGQPLHPATRGGLCPAGHAAIWDLVGEDRLHTPLRRWGPRGGGQWEQVGWDVAVETLSRRLQGLRVAESPDQFLILENGLDRRTSEWIDRFSLAYGSPNHVVCEAPQGIWQAALRAILGPRVPELAPDLARAGAVLVLGHELLETDGQPVWQSKEWARWRDPDVDRVPPFIYAGTRITPTAAKADLFLPCRPGAEGTVALGIAAALFQEGLVDDGFLAQHAGADVGVLHEWLRENFHPLAVEGISGVAPDLIFRAARALGKNRGLALVGWGPLIGRAGTATAEATVVLNAVLGSIGRPGGWVAAARVPLRPPSKMELDAIATAARDLPRVDTFNDSQNDLNIVHRPGRLWHELNQNAVSRIDTMLICDSNPLRQLPDPGFVKKALSRISFIAVLTERMDETADQADLVLPLASGLESWGLSTSDGVLPFPVVSLRRPVVAPLGECRSIVDLLADLAGRCIPHIPGVIPTDGETRVRNAARGLFESASGIIPRSPQDVQMAAFMERGGWRASERAETWESFWKRFRDVGIWAGPTMRSRKQQQVLHSDDPVRLLAKSTRRRLSRLADRDLGGRASRALRGEDPSRVCLMVGDTNTLWRGRTAATPLMREMAAFRQQRGWETICEVNPVTARVLNLRDDGAATLSAEGRSVAVRVRLSSLVPPGTAGLTRGLSPSLPGNTETMRSGNPMQLIALVEDEDSGHWRMAGDAVLQAATENT